MPYAFLKFIYSEKATKFCEISTLLLTTVHRDKSKVDITQNFVAFSEYNYGLYQNDQESQQKFLENKLIQKFRNNVGI